MRVAIIGAGVQGLSLLVSLTEAGFDCIVFDAAHRIGGVWSKSLHVPYLSLQLASRHYRFPDFPWCKNVARPSGERICEYLEAYVEQKCVSEHIILNAKISNVCDKGSHCTFVVNDAHTLTADIVICTGTASIPKFDDLYRHHKQPVHTSDITQRLLSESKGCKCVVIGGSKSAADAVYHFSAHGADTCWVARRFNTFAEFDPSTTIPLSKVAKCLPSLVSGNHSCLFDLKIRDDGPVLVGSGNVLTREEYKVLKAAKTFRSAVKSVDLDAVTLTNDTVLRCDLLIVATGYHTNDCSVDIKHRHGGEFRRVIKAKGLANILTTFGCINSHLYAQGMVSFLRSRSWERMPFNEWWHKHSHHNWGTGLYQIQYLCTSNGIRPYSVSNSERQSMLLKVSTSLISISVILLIIICIFRRRFGK